MSYGDKLMRFYDLMRMVEFQGEKTFSKPPDILIGGITLEDRVRDILSKFHNVNNKYYFLPEEEYCEQSAIDELTKNYNISISKIAFNNLAKSINASGLWKQDIKKMSVALDFTGLSMPLLFIIMKKLKEQFDSKALYLIYSEPYDYIDGGQTIFTENILSVSNIPGFFSSEEIEGGKNRLLIILLGFEGKLITETHRAVQPDKIIAINGFPAFRPGLHNQSLLNNIGILKEIDPDVGVQNTPANNPFETAKLLSRLYETYKNRYNIYIAPLGTKPQGLGACLFALDKPDINIVYPFPEKIACCPSRGVGKQWYYEADLL
ncbi:MAG TPA: hypothetical protein DDX93_03915 [Smithella sp.]|jgi:hypothetical protein|nr:hypothetical protein [Smithella sp.]